MRPLPRVLAVTDARVVVMEDFGRRAAAIAAVGPSIGLVARNPDATGDGLSALALRLVANARPPMATVLVSGRADIALAVAADGVVRNEDDLTINELRSVAAAAIPTRFLIVLAAVHSEADARSAASNGADALIVGNIWATPTHPDRPGAGVDLIRRCTELGPPVYAIGGVNPGRAREARDAGAYGVAAIRALWDAPDPFLAARELVEVFA